MFDEALDRVRDAGYSVRYSNDCMYPCLRIEIFNDRKKIERMIDHHALSDEETVARFVLKMLDELEKLDVEAN